MLLRNNIIANNGSADVAINAGTIVGSHNVIRTGATGALPFTITADPLLNALGNNGGSANTMSLRLGSPALNAGLSQRTLPIRPSLPTVNPPE